MNKLKHSKLALNVSAFIQTSINNGFKPFLVIPDEFVEYLDTNNGIITQSMVSLVEQQTKNPSFMYLKFD